MEYMSALREDTFDDLKPSLFELLSEQQLASLIPPSLRYLLTIATHRHPRYLLRILNSFDELYALCMLLVERHYLKTHSGGFTENFYGLKRERSLLIPIPRTQLGTPSVVREALALKSNDIWKNLAVMVGLPYLKRKLDEGYDINAPRALLGGNYTRLPPNPTFKQRFLHYYRWFLTKIYPSINAAYYFSMLAFNLAYLFDNSKFHSPFLWLIGTRMRRLGEADYRAIAKLEEPSNTGSDTPNTSIFDPRTLHTRLLSSLKFVLPTSIFALKFLEWWHASDFARQLSKKAAEGLELPPPIIAGLPRSSSSAPKPTKEKDTNKSEKDDANEIPKPPISSSTLLPILVVSPPSPTNSELCPICEEEIQTATACQTGFVFCYTCIHRWVEGNHEKQERFMVGKEGKWESGRGRCAVTGRRVLGGTEGLRRIMV